MGILTDALFYVGVDSTPNQMARGSTSSQGRAARSEAGDRLRERARALDEKAEKLEAKKALKEKKLATKPATEFYENAYNGATEEIVRAADAGTKLYAEKNIVPTSKQLLGLSGLDAKAIKGAVAIGDPVVTRKRNGALQVSQSFEVPYTQNDDGSYRSAWYAFSMDLKRVPKGQKVKLEDLVSSKSGMHTTLGEGDGTSTKYKGVPLDKDDV